jgi:DNA-binding NarL/FixJ family response regulator
MIKVLLVDDMASVLRGLRMRLALEPDLLVVGEATDGKEALKLARNLRPDVVVMDVEMRGMDGIAATQRLRELVPGAAVVILSIHDDADTKTKVYNAGAAAFVEKRCPAECLIRVIRSLLPGTAVNPAGY